MFFERRILSAKIILYSELSYGQCNRGVSRKRYKGSLKNTLILRKTALAIEASYYLFGASPAKRQQAILKQAGAPAWRKSELSEKRVSPLQTEYSSAATVDDRASLISASTATSVYAPSKDKMNQIFSHVFDAIANTIKHTNNNKSNNNKII